VKVSLLRPLRKQRAVHTFYWCLASSIGLEPREPLHKLLALAAGISSPRGQRQPACTLRRAFRASLVGDDDVSHASQCSVHCVWCQHALCGSCQHGPSTCSSTARVPAQPMCQHAPSSMPAQPVSARPYPVPAQPLCQHGPPPCQHGGGADPIRTIKGPSPRGRSEGRGRGGSQPPGLCYS
jgi:hypothetical protein